MRFILVVWLLIVLSPLSAFESEISGRVLDLSGESLEYATITLYQDSSIVKGAVSDSLGYFKFKDIATGKYQLVGTFMGYQRVQLNCEVPSKTTNYIIQFSAKEIELEEVVISSSMPVIRRRLDRYIVDMQHSVVAKNKTGLQLLNLAPGLIVSKDDLITLNGKENVLVMINGRKLNMSQRDISIYLNGLSGSDIDRVEVISSPGAQYDAEGQGGIIDIQLTRNARQGLNGYISGKLEQAHNLSPNVAAGVSYNHKTWTLYTHLGYRLEKDYRSEQDEIIYPETNEKQNSSSVSHSKRHAYNYRVGIQNNSLNDKHLIGLEMYGNRSTQDDKNLSSIHVISNEIDSLLDIDQETSSEYNTFSCNFNYRYKIKPDGQDLLWVSDYTRVTDSPDNLYHYSSGEDYTERKNKFSTSEYDILTTQIDYTLPFQKDWLFKVGSKASLLESRLKENLYDWNNAQWNPVDKYSYLYSYREMLAACYLSIDYRYKFFEGSVGLRSEFNRRSAEELKEQNFEIFPSFQFKVSLSDNLYFTGSYARRTDRPPYKSLVPYYSFDTPYYIRVGNPALTPSIVNAFSFSTGYRPFSISVNYDKMVDNIYYIAEYDPLTGIRYGKNENIDSGSILSVGGAFPITICKWWDTFTNIVYRYKAFDDAQLQIHTNNHMFMFRSEHSFSLPADIHISISASGMSNPMAGPMVKQSGGFMFDAAISKAFLQNKLDLTLSMDDITGLLNNLQESTSYNNYLSNSSYYMNSQVISLSARYNFEVGRKFRQSNNRTTNYQEMNRISE